MGNWKNEYDMRLRRLCGVVDDTLRVKEDSEIRYGGGCETCAWEYSVVVVTVYDGVKAIASCEFESMSELINALDGVEL